MGKSKKHKGHFQKGHKPYILNSERWSNKDSVPTPTKRLSQELHNLVQDAPSSAAVNLDKSYRLLRPKAASTVPAPPHDRLVL